MFTAVKAAVDIPVFAVGGIRTPQQASRILSSGHADLIGVGRPFYAEPDLARWFPESEAYETESDRPSYARRLVDAGLNVDDVNQVRDLYARRLRGQVVGWWRTTLYVQATVD